jgi:CheY-like chemotaxis protein
MGEPSAVGLLLSDDLIFTSRILGVARERGVTLRVARRAEELIDLARQAPPAAVILDLAAPGLDVAGLMGRLRQVCDPPPRVVAYGPHVQAELLKEARAAGCDPVLPRSKFVEVLPDALAGWAGAAGG